MTLSDASATGQSVSILMLTLNEEGAIAKVLADIRKVVPDAEIVVVDSSDDLTTQIAENLGCKVVRQIPPKGYGFAMDAGFKAASRPYIVTLDCDDTYPCESIKTMLELAEQGYDLVSGSRLKARPSSMSLANYLANKTFVILAALLCGVKSSDLHTGMRLYRKTLVDEFDYDPVGMALPVDMQIGPARLGYRCTEIFIDYKPRIGESKLMPIPGTIWTLKRIWTWRRFFNSKRVKMKLD